MDLYNTLTRKIDEFKPLSPPNVTLYTCGPTVYDYTHLGHIRKYTNDDVLKRTLTYLGYKVKHVMNITDVGHLVSDEDAGEDKLEKGAKKTGKTVWEVAAFYTDFFMKTIEEMNIIKPDIFCKATDNIQAMIDLIKILEEKGFTYKTKEALYFDIGKFPSYGKLSRQKLEDKSIGARDDVIVDPHKKNPADFALWFFTVGRFADHTMHWDSPWGDGFPGWHIECSAMSMKYLGETIDIHTGGVDHIPVHHENEIAQSEAATGKTFVRCWVHDEFLLIEGQKMSKSLGNFLTIDDFIKKEINPLALRLLFLQTHYRQQMNFTWDSIHGAEEAYKKLKETVIALRQQSNRTVLSEEKLERIDGYRDQFRAAISNDLQMPQAVAVMFEVIKSNIPSTDKLDLVLEFDQVLGLKLSEAHEEEVPEEIKVLVQQRKLARDQKDWQKSDELRNEIESKGYILEDTSTGYKVKKK
jgi:cysteinyl-tRNA synthetase